MPPYRAVHAGTESRDVGPAPCPHDAVLRNLEVLGEAAKNVPHDVRGLDDEIPWRRIAGLRDVLAHDYFGIVDDIVERRGRGSPALAPAIGRTACTTLTCHLAAELD